MLTARMKTFPQPISLILHLGLIVPNWLYAKQSHILTTEYFHKTQNSFSRIQLRTSDFEGRIQTFNVLEAGKNDSRQGENENVRWIRESIGYDSKKTVPIHQIFAGFYRVGIFERSRIFSSFFLDERVQLSPSNSLRGVALKTGSKHFGSGLFYSFSKSEILGNLFNFSFDESFELLVFAAENKQMTRKVHSWGGGFEKGKNEFKMRTFFSRNNQTDLNSSGRNFYYLNVEMLPLEKTKMEFSIAIREPGFYFPAGEIFMSTETIKYSLEVRQQWQENWNTRFAYSSGQFGVFLYGDFGDDQSIRYHQSFRKWPVPELRTNFQVVRRFYTKVENQIGVLFLQRLDENKNGGIDHRVVEENITYFWPQKTKTSTGIELSSSGKMALEIKNSSMDSCGLLFRWENFFDSANSAVFQAVYRW